MGAIIKAAQVILGRPHQVGRTVDLAKPDSGVTPEERAALIGAGMVIGGQQHGRVISLEDYRWKRQWLGRRPKPAPGPYGCMDPRD